MNDDWSAQPLEDEKPIALGEFVMTPIGFGKIVDEARTPVGMVYRVETISGVKDFFEQDVRLADRSMAIKSVMSNTKRGYNKFHTTIEHHNISMRKYGPLHSHNRMKKAAIDPFLISGEKMYHSTDPKNVKNILEHGILPHDYDTAESRSYYAHDDPRMTPRSNHSYIGAQHVTRWHGNPYLEIDMDKVDPNKVNSDEDWFDSHHNLEQLNAPEHVRNTYQSQDDWWDRGGDHPYNDWNLGQWADENSHWIDHPENVAHSFVQGSVGVQGGVPADAIRLNPNLTFDQQHELAKHHGWTWVNKEMERSKQVDRVAKTSADMIDQLRRPWVIQDWRNPAGSVVFGEPGTTIAALGVPEDERGMPAGFMNNNPSGYINNGKVVVLQAESNQYINQVQHAYDQQYKTQDDKLRTQYMVGQQPQGDFGWQQEMQGY